jgi:hypothetical protein
VYFTDAHLADYDLVLGQHGVLERLTVSNLWRPPYDDPYATVADTDRATEAPPR